MSAEQDMQTDQPKDDLLPLTHPELEAAIKHVTAYDDCQIGMLDYTQLWRLIVASRQYVQMLRRCEEMRGALIEAERFLDYFANGHTTFAGGSAPKTALSQVRAAIAGDAIRSPAHAGMKEALQTAADELDAASRRLVNVHAILSRELAQAAANAHRAALRAEGK